MTSMRHPELSVFSSKFISTVSHEPHIRLTGVLLCSLLFMLEILSGSFTRRTAF